MTFRSNIPDDDMKQAYYFSHDSNAHSDVKMLNLRYKWGWAGYGLYWAIIEKLRDADEYQLPLSSIPALSFNLHADAEMMESIIKDFELFIFDDEVFYSDGLKQRMVIKDEKSLKAKQAAEARWGSKRNANALHKPQNAMPNKEKERKGKEKKVKEIQIDIAFGGVRLSDTMKEFVQHRKLMKAPMTELAVRKLTNKLESLSGGDEDVAVAILEQSIMNGWKSVFELREDKKQTQSKSKTASALSTWQEARNMINNG